MSAETMIEVVDLKKDYGGHPALRGIGFEVSRGEVLGFLGPNGAGKTTTMKILTCFMAPSSGSARVHGLDVLENSVEVRRHLGYLPEDTPIYGEMTTLEFLEFIANVRRVEGHRRQRRIRELVDICGLSRVLAQPIAELSKGFRQRVGLAQAMLHDPPILVLDEPTSGLDPNQIAEIRDLIREIGTEKTVILSTHILPEVQATCGRVLIITDGRLVADGSPQELTARDGSNTYRMVVDSGEAPRATVDEKLQGIAGVTRVAEVDTDDDGAVGLVVSAEGDRDLRRDLFTCIRDNGWVLLELQRQAASLEDVFRKLTRE